MYEGANGVGYPPGKSMPGLAGRWRRRLWASFNLLGGVVVESRILLHPLILLFG